MKKLTNLISILAMVFLLAQSTIGVVSYFNTEEPTERSGMMGGQPPSMQGDNSDSTQSSTDTSSSASSSTADSTSGDSSTTTQSEGQMTPPSGMNGEFPGNMDRTSSGESKSTASLVGYIAGIIVSLGGLVLTFLTWRKKDKPVEN